MILSFHGNWDWEMCLVRPLACSPFWTRAEGRSKPDRILRQAPRASILIHDSVFDIRHSEEYKTSELAIVTQPRGPALAYNDNTAHAIWHDL